MLSTFPSKGSAVGGGGRQSLIPSEEGILEQYGFLQVPKLWWGRAPQVGVAQVRGKVSGDDGQLTLAASISQLQDGANFRAVYGSPPANSTR